MRWSPTITLAVLALAISAEGNQNLSVGFGYRVEIGPATQSPRANNKKTTTSRTAAAFYRDPASGRVLGGISGHFLNDWLKIDVLWIGDRLRGGGRGAQLLHALEQGAVGQGVHRATLVTTSFQAPGFYKRMGYDTAYTSKDLPVPGMSQHVLVKRHIKPISNHGLKRPELVLNPRGADLQALSAGLRAYNKHAIGGLKTGLLNIAIVDKTNRTVGQTVAMRYGDWLLLEPLHFAEKRHDNPALNAAVLEAIETHAQRSQVKWLGLTSHGTDTKALVQAGFHLEGKIEDFPTGSNTHSLRKAVRGARGK